MLQMEDDRKSQNQIGSESSGELGKYIRKKGPNGSPSLKEHPLSDLYPLICGSSEGFDSDHSEE